MGEFSCQGCHFPPYLLTIHRADGPLAWSDQKSWVFLGVLTAIEQGFAGRAVRPLLFPFAQEYNPN